LENPIGFVAITARENKIWNVESIGSQEKLVRGSALGDRGAIQGFFQINRQANIVFHGQLDFPCEIG
jgi:hypothetical protein